LIFAGKNVPFVVYGAVILLVAVGAYSTIKKVRKQIVKTQKSGESPGKNL